MKNTLRIIAATLLVGSLAYWAAAGANCGWTKTRVPTKITDEVTGLEGVQWQSKFVPGVDFLGAAVIGAAALTGVSFLFRKNQGNSSIKTKT